MTILIHGLATSNCTRRVVIVLNELGIDYKLNTVSWSCLIYSSKDLIILSPGYSSVQPISSRRSIWRQSSLSARYPFSKFAHLPILPG